MINQSRGGGIAGWGVAALVVAGVFTAWMNSAAEHFLYASALIMGAVWLVYSATVAGGLRFHWLALVPVGCATWAGAQVAGGWTVSSYETWNAASGWLALAAVFSLAYAGFQDQQRREACLSGIVWFGGAYALLGLLSWYTGDGSILWFFQSGYTNEVAATFGNRDQFAVLIEILFPFALAMVLSRPKLAIPAAVCAGVMFASVVASASRAGVAIVTVEALVFVAAACSQRRANYRAAALVVAAVVVWTTVGGWSYVVERFSEGDPFAYRREMLIATIDMIRSRPLTGFGLGTWPAVYPQFAVFDPPGIYMNHAHNDWAEWAADGGVPMVTLLGVLAVAAVLLARRRLWAVGVSAAFAHALVDFPLHKAALACALMFVVGLAAASLSEREDESPAANPRRIEPQLT